MIRREIICKTPAHTEQLGRTLAEHLFPGAFIALTGDLGAGKTAFVKGIGLGLGADTVASPTFTIVEEHDTNPRLYHFDVYRLSGEEELYAMGYEDYLDGESVVFMEWANLVPNALPEHRLEIQINILPEGRCFVLAPYGEKYEELVETLCD
ncbi:MAG: tRNA (adenosine(37)-N6)-threonylcarbamoyltransferase complex ATPase subunit type 1 TsaE [Clostridia bacterium]|nr:tRNA (adenosine(37)-N6)-threonylcarbamoyltransferase complex ATPase subunit type 1 TsaE [Clostridia bacterium]